MLNDSPLVALITIQYVYSTESKNWYIHIGRTTYSMHMHFCLCLMLVCSTGMELPLLIINCTLCRMPYALYKLFISTGPCTN